MGFALTVAYVVVAIISPEQFGPEWASYHALTYLAGATFLASLPSMLTHTQFRLSIQTFQLLGFVIAIGLSQLTNGSSGGTVGWLVFLPSAAIFLFIVANANTLRRLKILTLAATASCLVVVVEALCGYYGGFQDEMFVLQSNLYADDNIVGQFLRLRGAGFLNDPNDLAQFLVIALPLIFIAWRPRRALANSLVVLVPAALLLWAIYLTHSRGGLIGLAVVVLMATRRKLGNTASLVLSAVLILGLLALDFTGGRAISVAEGFDRFEAWATGLELFRSSPLFGIGFGAFTHFNDITAHNSFVLCLAELGVVGSTIWVALLVTTMMGLNRIIQLQAEPASAVGSAHNEQTFSPKTALSSCGSSVGRATAADREGRIEPEPGNIVPKHWAVAMRLALISYIVTGWLLSRSYQIPLYLVLGLATAAIALERPAESRIRHRWVFPTLAVEAVAVILVYGSVRLR